MKQAPAPRRARKKGLGRGLDALIPKGEAAGREYFECAVGRIRPAPGQPRRHFDPVGLEELTDSIRESGLIQPLVVRPVEGGAYELIAGERRWRACQKAGLERVPVVVREVSDAVAFALALIENIQRRDLDPVEEAEAYRRLLDDFDWTQAQVAEAVGKSRSAVSNALRLLGLPRPILDELASGSLTAGHARALVPLDPERAAQIAHRVAEEGLSVREVERLAKAERDPEFSAASEVVGDEPAPEERARPEPGSELRDERHAAIARRLGELLGARVDLRDRGGRGRVEIHYDDVAGLRAILAHFAIHDLDA